ncbi:MAG: aldo/keto reductase [Thaumarchaeota archaeon]|nr:aldo/keto reductase [Candidatus Calditenuaceae archaeon]MDW8186461.1 aldo/keto reductase [Nitrososphaerota archaeon]
MLMGRYESNAATRFVKRAVQRGVAAEHFRSTEIGPISSLGLGTYLGDLNSETDELMTNAVVHAVSEGAVNVVDTAINYRWMASERCVGSGLRSLVESGSVERGSVLICTKAGYLSHDPHSGERYEEFLAKKIIGEGLASPNEIAAGIHCIAPKYVEWSVRKSIANMNLEAVDVVYLHNVGESQSPVFGKIETLRRLEGAFRALEELRAEGYISWYGMATWSSLIVPEDSEEHLELEEVVEAALSVAGRSNGFKFVQLPLNYAMRSAIETKTQTVSGNQLTAVEAAKALGLIVVTSAPLLQGRLLRLAKPLGRNYEGLTTAQALIQFCRRAPVTTTLVGAKSPEHVRELIELAKKSPAID